MAGHALVSVYDKTGLNNQLGIFAKHNVQNLWGPGKAIV